MSGEPNIPKESDLIDARIKKEVGVDYRGPAAIAVAVPGTIATNAGVAGFSGAVFGLALPQAALVGAGVAVLAAPLYAMLGCSIGERCSPAFDKQTNMETLKADVNEFISKIEAIYILAKKIYGEDEKENILQDLQSLVDLPQEKVLIEAVIKRYQISHERTGLVPSHEIKDVNKQWRYARLDYFDLFYERVYPSKAKKLWEVIYPAKNIKTLEGKILRVHHNEKFKHRSKSFKIKGEGKEKEEINIEKDMIDVLYDVSAQNPVNKEVLEKLKENAKGQFEGSSSAPKKAHVWNDTESSSEADSDLEEGKFSKESIRKRKGKTSADESAGSVEKHQKENVSQPIKAVLKSQSPKVLYSHLVLFPSGNLKKINEELSNPSGTPKNTPKKG